MTEDSSFTIRPQSGPFKSPREIVNFYNKFDGWQEVLPKTDNTYSPGSKYYKYEVSPGIPFIPNMSRRPLKSYEKTPIKHDFSEVDYNTFASSHIKRKLFTSTTYKYYKGTNHSEIQLETEETFIQTESKISKIINYTYQSVNIFIKFIVSYFISTSILTNIHKSVMETGSNIINTVIRKITNWVHLTTITFVHYDLIIITTIRRVINHYFGRTKMKNLVVPILFLALILFLIVAISNSTKSLNIPVWQESWTNFLISPFISILNLITSIFQIFSSTIYFVFDLITVTFASSLVGIKLLNQYLFNLFYNIDIIMGSATQVNTIPIDQNSRFIPFDYNMLAKKVLASEEFQRVLINQLNISQSDFVKLHDKEFQQLFRNQLEEINSENLNLINDQLYEHKNTLKNIYNKMSDQEKESIQLMDKKISELQNILSDLTNKFETFKSKSILKTNTESNKEACIKDDWNSIVNYIEQYVNITMKSTLNIYDADKTGMVDYALESAGATVLGTRCTQTKASTAALTLFGIPLWFISNGPRLAIQPGVYPGQCWAFIGAKGFLVLRLSKTIRVTGFTIEHLPKSLSEDGHIRSAPKDFSIWGLRHETDSDGKILGKYQFKVDGPSLQYFSAEGTDNYFSVVELRIESNHGHEEYTCLYRIRVHGNLA